MSDVAAAVEAILERRDEADDVLRAVVSTLVAEPEISWAGIAFAEGGTLVLGPSTGAPNHERRIRTPIPFQDSTVGELWVDGEATADGLERVAALIGPLVLIGWDTGGEAWEP